MVIRLPAGPLFRIKEFQYLTLAELISGRPVDARHLDAGIRMLGTMNWLPEVALRMQGEVGKFLIEGLDATLLNRDSQAQALCLAAVWCAEHREACLSGSSPCLPVSLPSRITSANLSMQSLV